MSTTKLAAPGTVLSLSSRFATKVGRLGVSEERVQQAIDDGTDPLWVAVTNVFCSQPDALVQQVANEQKTAVPRIEVLSERPKPCALRSVDEQVSSLKEMHRELRWTWTDSGLIIPKRQKGIDRLIVLADTGLANNRVFDVSGNSFPSWRYVTDLDSTIPADKDQRHPAWGVYAIWVRDDASPDRNLLGLSASQIAERNLKTMTLLEYMLNHLIHFRETGEHLDPRTWTLCSGSRDSDGFIPYADWDDGVFEVYRCNPDNGNPSVVPRQAVTL